VVARSGYTTVMELAGLGLGQVVMVPTPGQSEQEYLADHLDRQGIAQRMDQEDLDLTEAQRRFGRYRGFKALSLDDAAERVASLSDFLADHPLFRDPKG
jgi:UDP-N-acetylglucosamine:LPS N-acetylglucosamine transferase